MDNTILTTGMKKTIETILEILIQYVLISRDSDS